jgi:hypothetical protein
MVEGLEWECMDSYVQVGLWIEFLICLELLFGLELMRLSVYVIMQERMTMKSTKGVGRKSRCFELQDP